MADAVNIYGPQSRARKRPSSKRGSAPPRYDPFMARVERTANLIWERAGDLANVLAPDVPADSAPLEDDQVWLILEAAAGKLSPAAWDDPAAIEDLIRLRQKFAQDTAETATLRTYKRLAELDKRLLPDPAVTPENPEWQKQQQRLRR